MLARLPEEIDESDFETLHNHGFTDDDIWDIGSITALFALSNRVAHLGSIQPNPEFFSMGR
jgi:alkylhydroperoxidase family enzyme